MKEEWLQEFEREMKMAREARASGNEGKARVCARRAMKYIILEYLRRVNIQPNNISAYGLLHYLGHLQTLDKETRNVAQHFLLKSKPDGDLPKEIDLIADAYWLAKRLLGKT